MGSRLNRSVRAWRATLLGLKRFRTAAKPGERQRTQTHPAAIEVSILLAIPHTQGITFSMMNALDNI